MMEARKAIIIKKRACSFLFCSSLLLTFLFFSLPVLVISSFCTLQTHTAIYATLLNSFVLRPCFRKESSGGQQRRTYSITGIIHGLCGVSKATRLQGSLLNGVTAAA